MIQNKETYLLKNYHYYLFYKSMAFPNYINTAIQNTED